MPDASFFENFGFMVRRGFLEEPLRSRIAAAMREAESSPARVRRRDDGDDVDPTIRSTKWAAVGDELESLVTERLEALRPEVAAHFGLPLEAVRGLQFLRYEEGDFFQPHQDNYADPRGAPRRLTCLMFANPAGAEAEGGEYEGGQIAFYGLLDDAEDVGFDLEPEPGTLVVFPAGLWHGVNRVTRGLRLTVVAWYG